VEGYVEPLEIALVDDLSLNFFKKNEEKIYLLHGDNVVHFGGYDNYWESGMSFRFKQTIEIYSEDVEAGTYSGYVYNILLWPMYRGEIVEGITMQSTIGNVLGKLGPPPYQDKTLALMGYKLADAYIFFIGEEKIEQVSLYSRDRGAAYNTQHAPSESSEYSLTNLMTAMTNELGDIEKLDYEDMDSVIHYLYDKRANEATQCLTSLTGELKYGPRSSFKEFLDLELGICVFVGSSYNLEPTLEFRPFEEFEGEWTIILYGDCGITEELLSRQSEIVKINPKKYLVFEMEKARIKRMDFSRRVQEEGVISPNGKWALMQNDDGKENSLYKGVYWICLDGSVPSKEMYDGGWDDPKWVDNRYFVRSIKWGVQIYDTKKQKVAFTKEYNKQSDIFLDIEGNVIVEKEANQYDKGILAYYDYSFDKNGEIHVTRREVAEKLDE
jgi:hypothetical protein